MHPFVLWRLPLLLQIRLKNRGNTSTIRHGRTVEKGAYIYNQCMLGVGATRGRARGRRELGVQLVLALALCCSAVGDTAPGDTVAANSSPPPATVGLPPNEPETAAPRLPSEDGREGGEASGPGFGTGDNSAAAAGEPAAQTEPIQHPREADQDQEPAAAQVPDERTNAGAAARESDRERPQDAIGDHVHDAGDVGFVIEEEEANHGLVEYSAPEEQALDHLINIASKGLRTLASGAVVGFHRVRMVVTRAASRIGSRPFSETLNLWLGANDSAREESMNAAHKALLSVHQTTAVVLAQAPDYIDRSRQVLDQVAQRSVERALEVAVLTAQVAEIAGAAGLKVARYHARDSEQESLPSCYYYPITA